VNHHDESDGSEAQAAGNLPAQLTSLVGRARELAELSALLAGTRLLTLTGPGGSGKSRLGLAVSRAHRGEYPGGAWWVDLASLSDPDLVAQHVALRSRAACAPSAPCSSSTTASTSPTRLQR
jgi:hypothetical protein